VTHGPPRIRNVYIPADELKLLFDSSAKGVFMPRDKVLALWQEAQRHGPAPLAPPTDVAISQAAYEAQLGDDELRLSGRIRIAKLRGGWQTVDLPFGGLAIESAQLGGEPARFGRKDDGTLFLVLEKEGRFELELKMSAPLASKGGDLATTLKLPPLPASEILVRLPKGKQLQVGETTLQADGTENLTQLFRVAVDRGGLVPLLISERFAGGNRAPLVLANSRTTDRIEPAGLRWEVLLDLDVYARATDSFQIQLPGALDLAEVEAPELAQWTTRGQGDGTAALALSFRKPFLGRRTVRLLGLAPIPVAKEWNVPTLRVLQSASHVGQVSVYCSPSLRLEIGTLSGVRPEQLSLPSASSSPSTAGAPLEFAFWDENFQLPLHVTARRGAMQASIATLVEVDRAGAALRSSVTVEPRHAPIFDLQMLLPRDWEVTSVLSANKPVPWEAVSRVAAVPAGQKGPAGQAGQAGQAALQTVRFDLDKPLNPGQPLEITLTAERHPEHWLEEDERYHELPLPALRLAGADEVEGTVLVQAPPDIELLVSNLSDDLQPVAAGGSPNASTPAPGTVLQYHYRDDARVTGQLQVRTKPAKVSAETLAFVRLDRGKLDVHYQLDLHIRQGTLRRIGFTLPVAVGEKIQIVPLGSAARVIEQRPSPLPGGGGKPDLSLWQIVLDRPVTGDLTLALDCGQTCGTAAPGASVSANGDASVAIPVLALRNVSRQSGTLAVEAANDQQIDCQPTNLRDLDPADVLKPRAYTVSHRIVAAYQYRRLPYGLTISATRHTPGSVLTAICESADITSVAGRQGRMRHQARFWLRSLNLPQVPVVLPRSADLWSVMLDSAPVEVRRKQGTYIVPLPAGQARTANAMRELSLVYETDDPRPAGRGFWERLWPQTVRQSAPQIGVATLGTTWRVHPPDGTDVVFAEGDFKPEKPLARPTLSAWLAETIVAESDANLPLKFTGLVVAGVIVGFFALYKSAKGCGSLLQILVVLLVIGVLIALLLPATQSAREASRRMMCTNNLKQIALALHGYHSMYGRFPAAAIGPSNVPRERQFSWIVALLPFLEQKTLYDQLRLDLPWDHPHNAALLQTPMRMLQCPSDPAQTTVEGFSKTSYVAVTGADSTDGPGNPRGIIGFDRGLSFNEIVDGTSNTILVAEVTDGGPWFAGGVSTARRIEDWLGKQTWSQHASGGNFAFADGSIRFLSSTMDPRTLRHLATAQGQEPIEDAVLDGGRAAEKNAVAPPAAAAPASPQSESSLKAAGEKAAEEKKAEPEKAAEEKPAVEVKGPAPTANAPSPKPSPTVSPQPPTTGGQRATLSLGVALETHGGQAIRFRREGGPGDLVLGLQDHALAQTLQWLMVAAALLAAWIWRCMPGPRRAMAVVAGLAVPIGLSGLVPLAWMPLLDGLLLGALAAACLWMLLALIPAVKMSWLESTAAVLAIGLGLSFAAASGMAAEEAPAVAKNPAAAVPAAQPNLTLFIPYDPEHGKPLESTQVYLPHEEFLRLWKRAHPDQPDPGTPSVQAMVSYAEYSGRLENDVARFDGRLLVHHFVEGWTPVALPLGKVAFEKIEINGRPATLAGDQAAIYLDKRGPHVVDVRFSVPVSRLGATGQMIVPLRPVSAGRLVIQLPSEDLDIQVSGAPGGWRRQTPVAEGKGAAKSKAAAHGESVAIPLGATNELGIRWQPRRVEAREGQLVSVDQALLVEVLDSGVHLHGRLSYRIQQGAVGKLRLRIPPDLAIQSVQGAEVADWSIETEPAAAPKAPVERLVVSLKTDLTTGTEVDIHAIRRDRSVTGAIDVHALEPLGVVRETGRVAVDCLAHFRVRVEKTKSVDQIDRSGWELPQAASPGCAVLWAYRYTSRPWRLQLQVERQQSRVEVSDRTAVAVATRQATLRSLVSAQVTGAPILSFALRLPASLRVSQVHVPPGADWFVSRDERGQQLKVELSEPAAGTLELAVTGTLARDASQAEFAVPGVIAEQCAAQRGQLAIYLDDDLQAVLSNAGGAQPIDPGALQSTLRTDGNRPAHYAFEYASPPKDLRLRLSPAPSRVNSDVTTVVSVREGAVAYVSKVDFEIRQAGRSQFRLVTPEWLGDDVEVQGEHIRQIRSQATGDRRTWEIELQQAARGSYCLHLVQTLPLPDDGTVPAAVIRPLDVERSRSHLVLENLTADEIAATTSRGVVSISIAAVPPGLADTIRRQAVAAYRVADDAAALVWQRRVREQETGLRASINLADLTTVIHADGHYRARAAYNVHNLTLQFLELALPPQSEVWSVLVSDQPVHPAKIRRQGRMVTLVPLQKISAGDFSSKVIVIYSGYLGEPLSRWAQVRPPAPQILSNIPVSRTLWTVLLPSEYQVGLVSGESNLEEVAAAYQQEERKLSFLDELRQMVQVASSRSKSAAQIIARENLKQSGAALYGYSQQIAPADAKNAIVVQEQAQQIQAEIKRLEQEKTEARRAGGETTLYFEQPRRDAEGVRGGVDLYRSLERLPEANRAGDANAAPNAPATRLPGPAAGGKEVRRGDLRKQAADQLLRLQTIEQQELNQRKKAAAREPTELLHERLEPTAEGVPLSITEGPGQRSQPNAQAAANAPAAAAGTGQLSLDLDVAPVGTAHHFRKLHGEPRLVLSARHEDVSHGLAALVWAGLCLAVAAAVIRGLKRPDALARARRGWPLLAAVAGAAWLFLLPAGIFGLGLLVTALCVMIARRYKRRTVGSDGVSLPSTR
jgi:prepilin-type processing-associated H-X9-DG protein